METKVINLLSGPECEFKRMLTGHQDILFPDVDESKINMSKAINIVLCECIVRIGTDEKITKEKIANLLSGDRKQILVELRNFSVSAIIKIDDSILETDENIRKYDPDFGKKLSSTQVKFTYRYFVENTEYEATKTEDLVIKTRDYKFHNIAPENKFKEYSEVRENMKTQCTLPESGKKIQYSFIDGNIENVWESRKKTPNTFLQMYRPLEIIEDSKNNTVEKSLDISKLSWKDSSYLRDHIMSKIGTVETNIVTENPNTFKMEKIDAMALVEFFFPKADLEISDPFGESYPLED